MKKLVLLTVIVLALLTLYADRTADYTNLQQVMSDGSPELQAVAFEQFMNLQEFDRMLRAGLEDDRELVQAVEEYADAATSTRTCSAIDTAPAASVSGSRFACRCRSCSSRSFPSS